MKIQKYIIAVILAFMTSHGFTQKLEYSGFFDSYYYKGIRNLNFTLSGGTGVGFTDMAKWKPAPAFGAGINYKLWPRVVFGAEYHYISLEGEDSEITRNLAFSSTNHEILAFGRFYFIDDVIRVAADRRRRAKFVKAYLMTGFGVVHSTAVTRFTQPFPPTDTIYNYNEPSAGFIPVIPAALGLSWRISNKVSLITEVGYRKTFSDHLDGISLRGNPKSKDAYWVADVKIEIHPFVKSKKKQKSLPPPEKYEGPKGTDTWKNRPKEQPAPKQNFYYEEEAPTEEQQFDENGDPIDPEEEQPTIEEFEEEPTDDGWN